MELVLVLALGELLKPTLKTGEEENLLQLSPSDDPAGCRLKHLPTSVSCFLNLGQFCSGNVVSLVSRSMLPRHLVSV
jgi:hypothetical protein